MAQQDGFFCSIKSSFATLTNKVFGRNATDKEQSGPLGKNPQSQITRRETGTHKIMKADKMCVTSKTKNICGQEDSKCNDKSQKVKQPTRMKTQPKQKNTNKKFTKEQPKLDSNCGGDRSSLVLHGQFNMDRLNTNDNKRSAEVINKDVALKTKQTDKTQNAIDQKKAIDHTPSKNFIKQDKKCNQTDNVTSNCRPPILKDKNSPKEIHQKKPVDGLTSSDMVSQNKICALMSATPQNCKSPILQENKNFAATVNDFLSKQNSNMESTPKKEQPKCDSKSKKKETYKAFEGFTKNEFKTNATKHEFKFSNMKATSSANTFTFTTGVVQQTFEQHISEDGRVTSAKAECYFSDECYKQSTTHFTGYQEKPTKMGGMSDEEKKRIYKIIKDYKRNNRKRSQDKCCKSNSHKNEEVSSVAAEDEKLEEKGCTLPSPLTKDTENELVSNPQSTAIAREAEATEMQKPHERMDISLTREFLTYPNRSSCKSIDRDILEKFSKEAVLLYLEMSLHQSNIQGLLSRRVDTTRTENLSENEFYSGSLLVPKAVSSSDMKLFRLQKRFRFFTENQSLFNLLNTIYFHLGKSSAVHIDLFTVRTILNMQYSLHMPALRNLFYSMIIKVRSEIGQNATTAFQSNRIIPTLYWVFEKYKDTAEKMGIPLRDFGCSFIPMSQFVIKEYCQEFKDDACATYTWHNFEPELLYHDFERNKWQTEVTKVENGTFGDPIVISSTFVVKNNELQRRKNRRAKRLLSKNNTQMVNAKGNGFTGPKEGGKDFVEKKDGHTKTEIEPLQNETKDSSTSHIQRDKKLQDDKCLKNIQTSNNFEEWIKGPAVDFSLDWLPLCKSVHAHKINR